MRTNGFRASTGGRRLFAVSHCGLVIRFPTGHQRLCCSSRTGHLGGNNLEQTWANQLRQLRFEMAFLSRFQLTPSMYLTGQAQNGSGQSNNSSNGDQVAKLDRYRAAMRQAQAIIVNHNGFDTNGKVKSQGQARKSTQQLGGLLHQLRNLQSDLISSSNNNGKNNVLASSGAGIPVTGGSGTNNSQNSGQNTNAGTAANNNQNANQNNNNNSPARIWGTQFRDLQAAQTWYNNFGTQPGKLRNSDRQAKIQQYLDQSVFALRQASAIVRDGGNNTSSNGQGSNQGWGTPQQQLGMWLHMMRGLRDKIGSGSGSNNSNGG